MRVTKDKLRMTTFQETREELAVIFKHLVGSYSEKQPLFLEMLRERTKGNGYKSQHKETEIT